MPESLNTSWFMVEVDGKPIGSFTEVSGLEIEIATETVAEGGQNQFEHKLPGRMSWPNLRLKRGLVDNDNFFEWVQKSSGDGLFKAKNNLKRTSAVIVLTDGTGLSVRRWALSDAFPVKWSGPTFAASGSEALSEELEIAHHGFTSNG